MTFDYNTLKQAAKEGSRLGNWKGKGVFAASAAKLDNLGNGAYYILYDDENKIVARTNSGWKSFGEVGESGTVHEYSGGCRTYTTLVEAPAAVTSYAPGYDMSEKPVGDIKLESDVEKVLKSAREMTVDSLLEGFNYGLSEAKG